MKLHHRGFAAVLQSPHTISPDGLVTVLPYEVDTIPTPMPVYGKGLSLQCSTASYQLQDYTPLKLIDLVRIVRGLV